MNKDELKELRLKLGLTQAKMGDELGLTASAVSHLESGKHKVTKQTEMLLLKLIPIDTMA